MARSAAGDPASAPAGNAAPAGAAGGARAPGPAAAPLPGEELDRVIANATRAATFLKAISHESRLMILCYLASGEKSVSQLEGLLASRQAAVSQQLARLRLEGLVVPRREGKAIYYALADDRARQIIGVVYDLFCAER